jgi:hypothetical protein
MTTCDIFIKEEGWCICNVQSKYTYTYSRLGVLSCTFEYFAPYTFDRSNKTIRIGDELYECKGGDTCICVTPFRCRGQWRGFYKQVVKVDRAQRTMYGWIKRRRLRKWFKMEQTAIYLFGAPGGIFYKREQAQRFRFALSIQDTEPMAVVLPN